MLRVLSKIFLLIIMSFGCASHNTPTILDGSEISVWEPPKRQIISKALNIVVFELDKRDIFTKEEMLRVLNEKHLRVHFIPGVQHEGSMCIFVGSDNLKNKCLSGYFNGGNIIAMVNKNKIHKTSFAHEVLHFFQSHLSDHSGHNPKKLWEDMVGYKKTGRIGKLNRALKKAGL